jgi:hypothetical protein
MSAEYQAAWQQKRRERGISEAMMSPETEAYAAKAYVNSKCQLVLGLRSGNKVGYSVL